MSQVTLAVLYKELKEVKNELRTVRYAVMPVEKIPLREKKELDKIRAEMDRGIKKSHAEVFKE